MLSLLAVLLGMLAVAESACSKPCTCQGDVCSNCSGTIPSSPPPDAADSTNGPDAGACAHTLACVSGPECDWSTAQKPSQWCTSSSSFIEISAAPCDGFDVVLVGGGFDGGTLRYYDATTGHP